MSGSDSDDEEVFGGMHHPRDSYGTTSITIAGAGPVEDASSAQAMLRASYMDKARVAYEEANYKAALLYMQKVALTDRASIVMFIDAAYAMWRAIPSDADNDKFGKTREQQEALESVKHAFTTLLAQKSAKSLVTAYEYIRLSHIYLAEGGLVGALQILQLASARGHLENTLVVLQSLTILTKLRQTKEVEKHITFLITDITLEDRSSTMSITLPSANTTVDNVIMVQNSNLPMAYVYLHCACYLKRRSQLTLNKEETKENMELCMHMIAEAYFIYFSCKPKDYATLTLWFNSPDLFFDMAEVIEATPFILLAEDSFWESFLRSQLSDRAISRVVSCMKLTKRGRREYLIERLESAYKINRWNLYCRRELLKFEALECVLQKNKIAVYGPRFEDEHFIASVMQGIMRGFLLRKVHWPAVYKRAKTKRDQWLSKVKKADLAYKKAVMTLMKSHVKRWSVNAVALHKLRKEASTKIQACWRRKSGELNIVKRYARADRANRLFLPLAQLNYDLQRVRTLRFWEKRYRFSKVNRAATCLARTLLANGYSKVLNQAVSRILGVIRVLRRNSNKKIFPYWKARYLLRKRKHARVTIRFFFRARFIKMKEKAQEKILASKQSLVEAIMCNSTTHVIPLKRQMWARWREELQKKRVVMARRYVAKALPRVLARQKDWKVVHRRRVKHELHRAFELQSLFRRVGRSLRFWRQATAMNRMQRMWRQKLARRAYMRQKHIVLIMKNWEYRRWRRVYRAIWFRWLKFCYLQMRSRHREARKITVFFKKIVRNRRVIRATRRKPNAFKLILTFHMIMLTKAFKKMSAGVSGLHTLMVLGPLFLSRWRQCVRLGFSMWRRKHINQTRMQALLRILTTRRLDKKFWVGASDSMSITPRLLFSIEEFRYRQMLPKAGLVLSWERPVKPEDVKYKNPTFFVMHKSFRAMMCCYRYRLRLKMNYDNDAGAYRTAERNVLENIRTMFKRARDVILLQSAWRIYAADKKRRLMYLLRLRVNEIILRMENKPRWRLFDFMIRRATRLREARMQLQCWYRQWKARKVSTIRRNYLAFLDQCVVSINRNSKSSKALLAKHLKKMVILYVYTIAGVHTHEAMTRSIENLKLRLLRGLMGPAKRLQQGLLKHTKGASGKHASNYSIVPPPRGRTGPSKSLSRNFDDSSIISHRTSPLKKSLSNTNMDLKEHGAMNALAAKKIASMTKHQSIDFHAHVFRLRQTGIFVFEANNGGGLSVMEKEYLLQAAQSIFCQNVASHAFQQILVHFKGNKFVLCGGRVGLHDMLGLLHFCGSRQLQLSLHFSDSSVAFPAVLAFLLCMGSPKTPYAAAFMETLCMLSNGWRTDNDDITSFADDAESDTSWRDSRFNSMSRLSANTRRLLHSHYDPLDQPRDTLQEANAILPSIADLSASLHLLPSPPPRLSSLSCLKELSVDTNSLGALGVAILFANMKDNSSIEVLIVTFSRQSLLPSLGKCIRSMAPNGSLKELRIFGEPLPTFEVEGLYEAVRNGLRGLRHLEFSASDAAGAVAEKIVNLAKNRLYAGRLSLSVSVN